MNLLAWFLVFRTEFSAKFSLRGKLISDLLLQAFKLIVPLLTWSALYQGTDEIGGYRFQDMAIYVLVMNFIGFVFVLSHGSELASSIKSGRLNALLLRPISLTNGLFAKFFASLTFNFILITLPLVVLVYAFDLNSGFKIQGLTGILLLLNLIFCFLFGLLFGLSAFWLDEVWPLTHLVRALIAIVGGLWFPLSFLPRGLETVFIKSPFAHLGYLNGAALMGKLSETELKLALCQAVVWIMVGLFLYILLLKRGLQKYEAVGA